LAAGSIETLIFTRTPYTIFRGKFPDLSNSKLLLRTPEKIKLFINDYSLPVKIIKLEDNYDYINFKLLPMRYNNISLIISSIKTDLSEYNIKILNLFEFLNPNLSNFINLSGEQKNNNENNISQIKSVLLPLQNNLYEILPYVKKKIHNKVGFYR